jgi:hypothetical protein
MEKLREASESVTTGAEVVRYMQDIVVFLRLSRAVGGGISAKANFQLARFAESVEIICCSLLSRTWLMDTAQQIPGTFTWRRLPYTFDRGSRREESVPTPHRCHSSWPGSEFTVRE